MEVFVVPVLLVLALLVGVALWSDHRDRRAGLDPQVRVDHLEQRRQRLRQDRTTRRMRRYLVDEPADRREPPGR